MSKRELATLRNATPQELVAAHSRAMLQVEMIWQIVGERLDKAAGDDRLCDCAIAAGEAEEMAFLLKALHKRADVLAARYGSLVPGGDDVVMPAFGGR